MRVLKEPELGAERASWGWAGAAGTPFTSESAALWGRKLHAEYPEKSSQIRFLQSQEA